VLFADQAAAPEPDAKSAKKPKKRIAAAGG
jgi:hypothetical protein